MTPLPERAPTAPPQAVAAAAPPPARDQRIAAGHASARQPDAGAHLPLLTVRSGPQAGISAHLAGHEVTIGRAPDNDIVLADPSVPAHAARLRLRAGVAELEAQGAPVRCGAHTVLPSRRRRIGAETRLLIGATELSLTLPQVRPRAGLGRRLAGLAGLFGGVALAAGAALPGLVPHPAGQPATRSAAVAAPPSALPASASLPAGVLAAAPAGGEAGAAALALAQALAARGLAPPLDVGLAGGVIAVAGSLPAADSAAWRAALAEHDSGPHARVPVAADVRFSHEPDLPRLAIQAVWAGPGAFVIAGDGERFGEGAVLPGGWSIIAITPDRLVLRRGGRTADLVF